MTMTTNSESKHDPKDKIPSNLISITFTLVSVFSGYFIPWHRVDSLLEGRCP